MNKCEICKCNKICDHNNFGFEICDNFIPEDVVKVVRCKDCKHFMEYSDEYKAKVEGANGDCFFRVMNSVSEQFNAVRYDDFCSYGERRTDGGKGDG